MAQPHNIKSGRMVGYARISTKSQRLDGQLMELSKAGCERVFRETAGGCAKRPKLRRAIDALGHGDALVVFRFDRLARSLLDLLNIVREIEAKGAHLIALHEGIDTSTSSGKVVFHVMAALADFERELIRERTALGLEAARARGVKLGRPYKFSPAQQREVRRRISQGQSINAVARDMGCKWETVARWAS